MIKVTVTDAHIAAAKPTPEQSPIALALREMGFRDVVVLENFVYTSGDRVYRLPENAIASQKAFKIAKNIHPYKCELEQIQ